MRSSSGSTSSFTSFIRLPSLVSVGRAARQRRTRIAGKAPRTFAQFILALSVLHAPRFAIERDWIGRARSSEPRSQIWPDRSAWSKGRLPRAPDRRAKDRPFERHGGYGREPPPFPVPLAEAARSYLSFRSDPNTQSRAICGTADRRPRPARARRS